MNAPRLNRSLHRAPDRPALPFLGDLTLALGRMHEIAGSARRTLAAVIASRMQGPIFWITSPWQPERLNPEGVCRLLQPGRLTFIEPTRVEDILWAVEEVLRSGAVPLVVADLNRPPALTPVRRLQLAAETGHELTGSWPLGLLLTPDRGGAPGVETRWHMTARHGSGMRRAWQLERVRARMAPPRSWEVSVTSGKFQAKAPRTSEAAG